LAETLRPSPWRGLALAAWLLIALGYLFFFVTDLRLDFAQAQRPCSGAGCNYIAISQAEGDVLRGWGWNPQAYALIINGATVLAVTVSWLLGGLIFWRQGATRIGWAVSLALIAIPVTLISDVNNVADNHPELRLPSEVLSTVGTAIFLLFLYLFPNGRFYPRGAFLPFLATWALFSLGTSMMGFGVDQLGIIEPWLGPLVTGLLLAAVAFQILRYRRVSTPVERQQTKWILLGFLAVIVAFPVWFLAFGGLVDVPAGQPRLLVSIGGWLGSVSLLTALPLSMAVAILRYRLWDIDLIIRRTLVYSTLTALLALTYFGSVIALQGLLRGVIGSESPLVIVLSTLLIAALFIPMRARVQRLIDRRFYRRKYDAARTLAAFGAQARDETDFAKLSDQLQQTVHDTMQPAHVALWLRPVRDQERR